MSGLLIDFLRHPLPFVLNQLEGLGYRFVFPLTYVFEQDQHQPWQIALGLILGMMFLSILTWLRVGKDISRFWLPKSAKWLASKDPGSVERFIFDGSADVGGIFCTVITVYVLGLVALILGAISNGAEPIYLLLLVVSSPFNPILAVIALVVSAWVAPVYWVGRGIASFSPKFHCQVMAATASTFVVLSFIVFFSTVLTVTSGWGQPIAAHHLHGLVKNTCIIDPRKEHCPRQQSDFEILETPFFENMLRTNQVFYKISADQNEYVLVVRYNKRLAMAFTGKLDPATGKRTEDYKDLYVNTIGQDRIENVPDFAKEFEYLPEWK